MQMPDSGEEFEEYNTKDVLEEALFQNVPVILHLCITSYQVSTDSVSWNLEDIFSTLRNCIPYYLFDPN